MKKCTNCGVKKQFEEFGRHKHTRDKLNSWCKKCKSDSTSIWKKTKVGVIYKMYSHQKSSSKKRGHKSPDYTRKEFFDWLIGKTLFHDLYQKWVDSNYCRWEKPSVDRIDDLKSYSFENIRLTTWRENNAKSHRYLEDYHKKQS